MNLNKKKFYISMLSAAIITSASIAPSYSSAAQKRDDEVLEPLRVEKSREILMEEVSDEKILRDFFPLNDSGIKFKEAKLKELRIIESPIKDPEVMFRRISVDPKKQYENKSIHLSLNYITTVSFTDKYGEPWPIERYSIPDGLMQDEDLSNSLLVLNPTGERTFYKGNMVVMLKNQKTPIIITLEISPDIVDYKASFVIEDIGPNSTPVSLVSSTGGGDMSFMASYPAAELYDLLEGVTPNSKYEKKTTSLPMDVEVWEKDKIMFVRTKEQFISPRLIPFDYQKIKSNNDVYLYTIASIPVIVLSINGRITNVNIR